MHALVEQALVAEGTSRHDLGREAFVERMWQWKAEYGGAILSQMRRLGDGVDWTRERFTMDEGRNRAVRTIFKRLYDDGLIYRAERIINWCPRCAARCPTSRSSTRTTTASWSRSATATGADAVVVATTRAETMLGDTAVAVHPDDERYRHLVGREIELPLTGRRIPIVADSHVDPEFGTGAVKVTPAHDPNDFEIGRRHDLPMPSIMDESGVITGTGPVRRPGPVRGARRGPSRRCASRAASWRRSARTCTASATPARAARADRAAAVAAVVRQGRAAGEGRRRRGARRPGRVHPKELEPRYFAWVDNMHDWCISRQLWWGHRIPVWYGPDGEIVCVGPDDERRRRGLDAGRRRARHLVLLGAVAVLHAGLAGRHPGPGVVLPDRVLVTGYDILFFWVARMMMFGLYAMDGEPPFDTIALHGMVRDEHGKKMSKSFGNVVDPLDWMDRFGADAVRFTLARGANPGTDVPIGEDAVVRPRATSATSCGTPPGSR